MIGDDEPAAAASNNGSLLATRLFSAVVCSSPWTTRLELVGSFVVQEEGELFFFFFVFFVLPNRSFQGFSNVATRPALDDVVLTSAAVCCFHLL
jgi:hypothetical protein